MSSSSEYGSQRAWHDWPKSSHARSGWHDGGIDLTVPTARARALSDGIGFTVMLLMSNFLTRAICRAGEGRQAPAVDGNRLVGEVFEFLQALRGADWRRRSRCPRRNVLAGLRRDRLDYAFAGEINAPA